MILNYDGVAPYYDKLANLVFGNKLDEAKRAHLDMIKPRHKILIVGGGSGHLLKAIDELGINCHVDFVEVSKAMMHRAQEQELHNITVQFYQTDILDFNCLTQYDIICTTFFFDQFIEETCLLYRNHLKELCHRETKWLYADFIVSGQLRDRVILSIMYFFFRITAGIGKVQLIDHKTLFAPKEFTLIKSVSINSQIISEVYKLG